MNKFFTLTRVLLKNSSGIQKTDRRRNLRLLIIAVAMLPVMISSTLLLMVTYDILKAANLEGVILAALLSAACLAMILFGILYVISTYYFSDDTVALITMPIRPHLILAGKFVIVTIYQYFLEAAILLPGIIAFGIKSGSIAFWVYSAIIFLALPVIPTVVCSVISLLLMAFGKFFRNKDRVKFIAGFLAIAAAIGINVAIQTGGQSFTSGSLINNSGLIKKAAMLFPTNLIAVNSMLNQSALKGLLFLVLFLLVSAAAIALFLLLGNGLYLNGVVGLTQNTVGGKQLTKERFEKHSRKRPVIFTLAMKDWRILYRTPVYFLNCILTSLILPPLMIVIFGLSAKGGLPPIQSSPMVIAIGVIIVCFFCIMNMASATAVSREGKNVFVSKYIPVPFRTQVFAKLLPGLALSVISLIMAMLLSLFVFKIGMFALVSIFVLSLIALTAFNMLGLFVDIVFPKLDWDDETAAVKRNLNVLIQLLMMFALLALITYLVYILKSGLYAGVAFQLAADLVILAAAAALLFSKGAEIYSGSPKSVAAGTKSRSALKGKLRYVLTAVVIVAVAGSMIYEFTLSPKIQVTAAKVEISAGLMESSSFEVSQIKSVYLKDSMPAASDRVGFASGNKLRGTFNIAGLGRGHVYTETGSGPFLFVILKNNSFTIFNFSDSTKTQNLYKTLIKYQ